MTSLFKRFFADRSLYYKFNLIFVLVALVPMSLLAYASYRIIDNRLLKDANEKIEIGLKSAWTEYYVRGEQMMYGMLQAASQDDVKDAVKRKDKGYLKDTVMRWKGKRPYVDIWIITDKEGKVITRLNSGITGDSVEINGLVEKAVTSGKSQLATEIIPEDIMGREGDLHTQVAPLIDSKSIAERYKKDSGDELAILVVTPVIDKLRGAVGAIITADILNNDPHIPDAVSAKLPWMFTTISLDGLRISTNLTSDNGRSILWTLLPAHIASRLGLGEKLLEDWALDKDFVSVFDPIKDNKGRVIGSLDVAVMKSQLWGVQGENMRAIATVTIIGILLSLLISLITTRRIVGPLKLLKQTAVAFTKEEADMTITPPADTEDEIKKLESIYNDMTTNLKMRKDEKVRHVVELESRNKQLAELNDMLTEVNEKLEVSYEEIQCQTEEIGASNEELRVVNEELEGKIAELRDANNRLMMEKEEKERITQRLMQAEKLSSLGEIVSGVAHELNNPLTTVMGFSELLLDKEQAKGIREQLGIINESSHRCKRIVDNLLTFARSYKLEKSYSDLNKVILDSLELKRYQLSLDNIEMEIDLDSALPKTMIDGHQLQQVFLNLINNAQHAIIEKGEGGGRITIRSSSEKDIIRIEISDTGKGIPADIAKKIFDPFFTTKDVGQGTGLGLSISYGIIKEHDGNIFVAGKPGEGATFVIELPIVGVPEKAQAVSSDELQKNQLTANGLRALVLDDEPNMLGLLKEALSNSGFHVDATSIGEEALKMLNETSYDLIMSDIKMPGLNGMEFHDRLKSERPETLDKVIFMTGDSMGKETQDFFKATGRTFLKKPFTIKGLRAEISRHITSLNPDISTSSTKAVL